MPRYELLIHLGHWEYSPRYSEAPRSIGHVVARDDEGARTKGANIAKRRGFSGLIEAVEVSPKATAGR